MSLGQRVRRVVSIPQRDFREFRAKLPAGLLAIRPRFQSLKGILGNFELSTACLMLARRAVSIPQRDFREFRVGGLAGPTRETMSFNPSKGF